MQMVERGIRIVGMMDYIDANSNIFFEYSLRAQGIFEEVVPAHRNEKGPCHRQIAPHKRHPGEGTSGRCLYRRFSYDIHTNMISYNGTGTSPVSRTMSYAGDRMTSVETPGAGGGAIRYDAIGCIVSSDIERLTQVRYNVVGYPSFLAQADGGYVDFSGEQTQYCWYTKDHLESIRTVALYMCDTTLLSRTDTATVCLYVDDVGYIQGSIKGAAYIKDCVYWYGNFTYAEILCDVSVEREDSLAFLS